MVFVEIVEKKTEKVVKRMGPMSERQAAKVVAGASINLNHDEFLVRVVPA
jgi:hypothetical protein